MSIRFCCDTSFLFSLYAHDIHTSRAVSFLRNTSCVLTVSPFNLFELGNALRLCEFRKILPAGVAASHMADFEQDMAAGNFEQPSCNLAAVLREATRLSTQYTARRGDRAFDVLHVASALHLKADAFLTFDRQQKRLAQSEGLTTPLLP